MRNSPLLDNGSVSTFPWKRIDAVSDELFRDGDLYSVGLEVTKKKLQSAPVQKGPAPVQEQRQSSRTDSSEVTARAPE
jgi:hypothetical protein